MSAEDITDRNKRRSAFCFLEVQLVRRSSISLKRLRLNYLMPALNHSFYTIMKIGTHRQIFFNHLSTDKFLAITNEAAYIEMDWTHP